MNKKNQKKIKSKKKTSKKTSKRRRKKKGGYLTGIYISNKCKNPIKYRSSWELYVCKHLDEDQNVLDYEYEPYKIPYLSNVSSKKYRNYIPDFVVNYIDGSQKIIEVKRTSALNNSIVLKKAEAAKKWCENLTIETKKEVTYHFWTEAIIFPIKKMFLIREKQEK